LTINCSARVSAARLFRKGVGAPRFPVKQRVLKYHQDGVFATNSRRKLPDLGLFYEVSAVAGGSPELDLSPRFGQAAFHRALIHARCGSDGVGAQSGVGANEVERLIAAPPGVYSDIYSDTFVLNLSE